MARLCLPNLPDVSEVNFWRCGCGGGCGRVIFVALPEGLLPFRPLIGGFCGRFAINECSGVVAAAAGGLAAAIAAIEIGQFLRDGKSKVLKLKVKKQANEETPSYLDSLTPYSYRSTKVLEKARHLSGHLSLFSGVRLPELIYVRLIGNIAAGELAGHRGKATENQRESLLGGVDIQVSRKMSIR